MSAQIGSPDGKPSPDGETTAPSSSEGTSSSDAFNNNKEPRISQDAAQSPHGTEGDRYQEDTSKERTQEATAVNQDTDPTTAPVTGHDDQRNNKPDRTFAVVGKSSPSVCDSLGNESISEGGTIVSDTSGIETASSTSSLNRTRSGSVRRKHITIQIEMVVSIKTSGKHGRSWYL